MSVSQRMRVPFGDVFPAGAYMVGEVEPVEDYEMIKAAKAAGREPGDVQLRDKVTEKRVWSVRVIDADPLARRGKSEVVVKISADQQPVPPAASPGSPFRPVEFLELTVTPYVDENSGRPRQAFSFRALGMKAPITAATAATKSAVTATKTAA
jgi:hypothetical protein